MLLKIKSYRTSKGKLLRSLSPMRREYFASEINPIVAKTRNISEDQARQQQFLRSDEVIAFLHKIGEPLDTYAKDKTILTHNMNKTKLRLLYPALSSPDFTKFINIIIGTQRKIPHSQASRKRYLLPVEVERFLLAIGEILDTTSDNA